MSFSNAVALATKATGNYTSEGSSKSRESSPRPNDRIGPTVDRVAKLSMHDSSQDISRSTASNLSPRGSFLPSQASKVGEDEALVEAIIADTQGDLSDALYLCSEDLIPSSKLFSAIMRRVHSALEALAVVKKMTPKTEEGEKTIELAQKPLVQLLNFTTMWVKKNRGTPPFRNCEDLLQMLIRTCFEQNDATINALTSLLSKFSMHDSSQDIRGSAVSKVVVSDVSPKGSSLTPPAAKAGGDEALVEAIIADTQGGLSEALYVYNEDQIPSSRLFAAIMRRVSSALEALAEVKKVPPKTEKGKKALELAQKPIVQLLNFSTMWVRRNRERPPFRGCEDLLQMLIKICFEQNDATIGALACLLSKQAFDVPLFWSQYARPFFQWSFEETFEGIVKCADDFFKASRKQEDGISRIAQDLYCYQVEVFRAFDQRDLIKSHMGGSFGASIKRHTEYANAIHTLVMETILERKALADRVKAIWAWLLIAQRSEDLGDYMNWMNICGGLEEFSICRLKKTWKEVEEKHPKQYAQMLTYRESVSKNYTKLEEEIKRRKEEALKNEKNLQFLPFVPSLLMKLVRSQELVSVGDISGTGVRRYNTQKIVGALKDVREYFSFQGNWDENKKPALPNTDVVFKALKLGPKNSDEREKKEEGYIAQSHALEPPKSALSA